MEEFEETPKYVRQEEVIFPEELIKNPLKFISTYYESIYPHMGKKVFQLLCLVPTTLIIPKIPDVISLWKFIIRTIINDNDFIVLERLRQDTRYRRF